MDGDDPYVRRKNSNEWIKAKVYNGDNISCPTSLRTSLPLANTRFMFAHPGPYTIDKLVQLAFDGELLKFYGNVRGFWTEQTREMYLKLLLKHNITLSEHFIKDTHTAFYKSIQKAYKGSRKYRQFLLEMGVDPDEVSGMKNVGKFLNEGRHIEVKIIEMLEELSAPLEYGHRVDNLIPDLYDPHKNEAIDIKRHIKTGIKKEVEKYIDAFSKVTVIHLIGSRTTESNNAGIRRVSIFKWIREQEFFLSLEDKQQDTTIKCLDNLVADINKKQAEQDRMDFHRKLVERIIELDKAGYNNREISEEVGFTYKYINRILVGKSLREYSGDYPDIYNARQEEDKRNASKVIPNVVKEFTLGGMKVRDISTKLGISRDMVKYHLANLGLNEKVILKKRNDRLIKYFNTTTEHKNLKEKFTWIVEQLIDDYPHIKFGAVKTFYYSYKEEHKNGQT